MVAELSQTEGDRAALSFAGGCLLAAMRERAHDADTHLKAGLWSIVIVTTLYAVDRLVCAGRGIAVLLGAPDGMREALLRHGITPAAMASYEMARPIVVGCFLALACAQFASAWFLSRGQIRAFAIAWLVALLSACIAVVVQLSVFWDVEGLPSEFHTLLLQALAVPALVAWSHHQHGRFQRGLR